MTASLDFKGKSVLVTGGARGVGRGITESFLAAGAQVMICGRNEPENLPGSDGNTAHFHPTDVRDPEQVNALVDATVKRLGSLDILVNNAGGAPFAEAATASPRFSEKIVQLNLLAPLNCAQAANRVMQDRQGGVIINIASVSGQRASPGTAIYGAAKAGLLNLTRSLAVEWAPKVRVVAITAGMIRTEQAHLHYGDDAGIAAVEKTVPLQRLGLPRDIGDTCLFLASPMASYISGGSVIVDGGGERPSFLDAANAEQS